MGRRAGLSTIGLAVGLLLVTFDVAFDIFVASNRRHFKFGMHVDRTKSQPMDDKLSLKLAWLLSRDLFNFWKISDSTSKYRENGTR